MSSLSKIALALTIASFIASSPVIAAETTPAQKPDLTSTMKEKASGMVEQTK